MIKGPWFILKAACVWNSNKVEACTSKNILFSTAELKIYKTFLSLAGKSSKSKMRPLILFSIHPLDLKTVHMNIHFFISNKMSFSPMTYIWEECIWGFSPKPFVNCILCREITFNCLMNLAQNCMKYVFRSLD